jgi:uncharacterized membrane protein
MEETAIKITGFISHGLEISAALIVASALLRMILRYSGALFHKKNSLSSKQARVEFGSAVSVSLELLLGADVLATAVAPAWDDIGKLAAIATIRTLLNFFLEKELRHSELPA